MKAKKGVSMLLTASMIASMLSSVAAFAAPEPQLYVKETDSDVILATYDANGSGSYQAKYPIEQYNVSDSSHSSGWETNSSGSFSIGEASVDVSLKSDSNISWTISGATEDLFLELDLGEVEQYVVDANSDTLNANDNTGGVGAEATCDVSKTQNSVDFGDSVTITFTAHAGQSITYLNIRNAAGDVNMVQAKTQNIQVGSNNYAIVVTGNRVEVTCTSVSDDVYVTALTKPAGDFSLTVDHDPHCTANVSTIDLDTLTSTDVRLTPENGYDIASIKITDGDYTETLTRSYTTAHINGKDYKAVWELNGSVTLTVPAATADVQMYVSSARTDDSYYVMAVPVTGVDVNCENPLYFQPSEKARIILTPEKDNGILEFKVTNGDETVTVSPANRTFMLGGVAHQVSVSSSGVVTVTITPGVGNIRLFDIETTRHTYDIKVSADSELSVSKANQTVNIGKTATVTFTPKKNYSVGEISVTRNGRTYTADAQRDSYINVNGVRCPIETSSNGKVTLVLNQVTADMYVYAESFYNGDYDYVIDISVDSGLDKSASTAYVDEGDDYTITFTPKSRYEVTKITVKRNGRTYTADPAKDDYILIAGEKCPISVNSKGVVKLTLKDVSADMTVKADSSYNGVDYVLNEDGHLDITYSGTLKYHNAVTFTITPDKGYEIKSVKVDDGEDVKYLDMDSDSFTMNGVRYTVNTKSNGVMTIRVSSLPSELTITASTNTGNIDVVGGMHTAYIYGYSDGTFRPDNTVTRGAAIAMLVRQYSGLSDAQLASFASYRYADVPNDHVFAGAIGWAANRGYLNCLTGNNVLKPGQPITRAEFVALLCAFEGVNVDRANGEDFSDVSNSYWAHDEIEYATEHGWIYGYSNGTFRPDGSLTRAHLVTIINRMQGRDYQNEVINSMSSVKVFTDVPTTYWAYYDILEASSTHYVIASK